MAPRVSQRAAQATLLARLGGPAKLDALVSAFYFSVLSDARVASFFADADIAMVLRHQRLFLAFALGDDTQYTGRSLRSAHRRLVSELGLTDSHFDAFVEILARTITNLGHDVAIVEGVIAAMQLVRDDVLGRP